jgi:hypothetical protein
LSFLHLCNPQMSATPRALRAALREPPRPHYDLWSAEGDTISPLLAPLPEGMT